MQAYKAPLQEVRFLLEAFGYTQKIQSIPSFEAFDLPMVMALLEQAKQALLRWHEEGDGVTGG